MTMNTRQFDMLDQSSCSDTQTTVTLGTVVDTNDPQNMGRLRIVCPQWGDTWSADVESMPWAVYMTAFGGQMQVGTRGPGIQESEGGVAYGLWAIPKVGAQVAVMCVDGNPMTRMWIGAVYDQYTPHTMPHGRFMYDDHPALEKKGDMPAPYGPYTSSEKLIQPLAANLHQQFGNSGEPNFEFRTRGADYSVSRVSVDQLSQTYSQTPDDEGVTHDGWTSTQGYQASRTDPNVKSTLTNKNYDSQTYAFTTPGFHSLSMDDRQENCRVRIRSTAGHQILLDDTNERIYISPAQGNAWVEIDQNGNIDVFSGNTVSLHATKDLNLSAGGSVRIDAGAGGIHLRSGGDVRIDATGNLDTTVTGNLNTDVAGKIACSGAAFDMLSKGAMRIMSDAKLSVKSKASLALGASTVGIKASGVVNVSGSSVNLQGATPVAADDATQAAPKTAFCASRKPQHEPFARCMTKDDNSAEPEFAYDDPNVNRVERGAKIPRGMFWRR